MNTYVINQITGVSQELPGIIEFEGLHKDYIVIIAENIESANQLLQTALIEKLWKSVHDYGELMFDQDFRMKCLSWKYDPNSSATKKQRIIDIETWADSIWIEYYRIKAKYLTSDYTESFNSAAIAARPWSFYDIATA